MDEAPSPMVCLPTLAPQLHAKFGGPHTQFASHCFHTQPSGTMSPAILVLSCTQLFLCDEAAFVVRVIAVDKLLAVYDRRLGPSEIEVLVVVENEHDLLVRGALTCEGNPPKPLIATLQATHAAHFPNSAPLTVHHDSPMPLWMIAKLPPPRGYVAPLPQSEESFDRCPCWRPADVLDISYDEFVRRVRNMFMVYCPAKLPTVHEVCRRYNRRRRGVLTHLISRYGPEPTTEHATAVQAVLEREHRFVEMVRPEAENTTTTTTTTAASGTNREVTSSAFNDASAAGSLAEGNHSVVSLATAFAAHKDSTKFSGDQPLSFAALLLSRQPNGGYGRVRLELAPVPIVLPQNPFCMFRRRRVPPVQSISVSASASRGTMRTPFQDGFEGGGGISALSSRELFDLVNDSGEFDLHPRAAGTQVWYVTNEGYVLEFETRNECLADVFGYQSGDRLLATWGVTRGRWSTVIGVRDGILWVHDDGDVGASALVGFESHADCERFNGWIRGSRHALIETRALPFWVEPADSVETVRIAPEEVFGQFGFHHGEVVVSTLPCSHPFPLHLRVVIAGVGDRDGLLYIAVVDSTVGDGPSPRKGGSRQATDCSVLTAIDSRCVNNRDLVRRHGWTSTGESECLRSSLVRR